MSALASSSGFSPISQPVVDEMEAAANKFDFACIDTDDSTSSDADDSFQSSCDGHETSFDASDNDGIQLSFDGIDTSFDTVESITMSGAELEQDANMWCDELEEGTFVCLL